MDHLNLSYFFLFFLFFFCLEQVLTRVTEATKSSTSRLSSSWKIYVADSACFVTHPSCQTAVGQRKGGQNTNPVSVGTTLVLFTAGLGEWGKRGRPNGAWRCWTRGWRSAVRARFRARDTALSSSRGAATRGRGACQRHDIMPVKNVAKEGHFS